MTFTRRRPRAIRPAAIRLLALVPLVVQLVVLLARSRHRWERYNLSLDFGIFHQAWHQVAHGQLSPEITTFGYPYWQSHFELVMWLLAPLNRVVPSGLTLLWLQDTATVAAEAVAIWWVADVLERRWPDGGLAAAGVVMTLAAMAALNPWIYVASGQDFHFEALGALFAVLAARDLWAGRTRRAVVWVALCLTTGDVSGTYVAGIGLSVLLADRRRWRLGLGLFGAGAGWIALVSLLDANHGSGIESYAWLIGRPVTRDLGGALTIVANLVLHPGAALTTLGDRAGLILRQLVPTGTIGIAAPWVTGPMALVLVENGLHRNSFFIHPSYQNLPVYVFGLAGTGMAVEWLARRSPWRAATALSLMAVLAAGAVHTTSTRTEPIDFYRVDAATAGDLASVHGRIPADAQVIASFGIGGRFAGRRYHYLHAHEDQVLPVRARKVAFVFAPGAGNQGLPQDHVVAVAHGLRDRLGLSVLMDGPRVYAYLWSPDPGTDSVTLSVATS